MDQQERIKRKYIQQILYEYRQRFGVPANLYKISVGEPNYETGKRDTTLIKINIPQLITGSVNLAKKFEYDISYIKANSNFAYGGFFEIGDRFAIVDRIYLGTQTIEQEDYIVYNGFRYNPQKILELDGETGYMLHLRQTKGQDFNQIHEVFLRSDLTIEQDIELEE